MVVIILKDPLKHFYFFELDSRLHRNCVKTVGKIYSPIFSFLRKRVVNISISELESVSNESSGNLHMKLISD